VLVVFFHPEDGGSTFLWNFGWRSTDYTAFTSQKIVSTLPNHWCENQISTFNTVVYNYVRLSRMSRVGRPENRGWFLEGTEALLHHGVKVATQIMCRKFAFTEPALSGSVVEVMAFRTVSVVCRRVLSLAGSRLHGNRQWGGDIKWGHVPANQKHGVRCVYKSNSLFQWGNLCSPPNTVRWLSQVAWNRPHLSPSKSLPTNHWAS
jgi:hypothetical protein